MSTQGGACSRRGWSTPSGQLQLLLVGVDGMQVQLQLSLV